VSGWKFVKPRAIETYKFVTPHIKNATIAGWNLLKPLPGHTLNATISAWNFIAPKAENVVIPALNFIGDVISSGFNFVTSKFNVALSDIEYPLFDMEGSAESKAEYQEVKLMIDLHTNDTDQFSQNY
jgi:hypothetical protein